MPITKENKKICDQHALWFYTAGAEGRKAVFSNANLIRENFEKKLLRRARFENCVLDCVSFKKADLEEAQFVNCSFNGTNFESASLRNSVFENTKLVKSVWFDDANIENVYFEGVTFSNCRFRKAKIIGTTFARCVFEICFFNRALFANSKLEDCNFDATNVFSFTSFLRTKKPEKKILSKIYRLSCISKKYIRCSEEPRLENCHLGLVTKVHKDGRFDIFILQRASNAWSRDLVKVGVTYKKITENLKYTLDNKKCFDPSSEEAASIAIPKEFLTEQK